MIGGRPTALNCGFEKLEDAAHDVVQVHWPQLRLRHFREIAEAADDLLQIVDFREQDAGGFAKHFLELLRILLLGALQILDRRLQREKRILQFMRQPARDFPPRGHAFRLHQPFALLAQLLRHFD